MRLTRRSLLWGAALLAGPVRAPALADDGVERARRAFAVSVSDAYGLDLSAVTVQPEYPGLPDNPFDPLAWGDYRAFRADFAIPPGEVFGFASVSGGPPAFARYGHAGQQGGISAILQAMQVLDETASAPLDEIVKRIAWCYPGFGRAETHMDLPWSVERGADGATVIYTASAAENTGFIRWRRITTEIAPGYLVSVRAADLG